MPKFILWQIAVTKAEILAVNRKIEDAKDRRCRLELKGGRAEKDQIELRYAQNDITRSYTEKQQLVKKMDILLKEYYGDAFVPYQDEVGMAEKQGWKMLPDDRNGIGVRLVLIWEVIE